MGPGKQFQSDICNRQGLKKPVSFARAYTVQAVKLRVNPSRSFSLEFSESLDFLCKLSFIKGKKVCGVRGKAPINSCILLPKDTMVVVLVKTSKKMLQEPVNITGLTIVYPEVICNEIVKPSKPMLP